MDLYHKPTDKQRFIPYSANHPKQCLKNIPFVMAGRICTIDENNSIKNKHLNELKKNFETCDYLEKIVEIGIYQALKIPQTILLQSKAINHNIHLTWINTFSRVTRRGGRKTTLDRF